MQTSGTGAVHDQLANAEAMKTRARGVTQQLVAERQAKVGGAGAVAEAPPQDVSQISDDAVQAVSPSQGQEGADVDGLLNALRDYVNGRLDAGEGAQKAKPKGGGGEGDEKGKKVKVEVEFQPHIRANTVQAPGDAIGEFRVRKEEVEESGGPGKAGVSQGSQQAGGAQAAQGAGSSSGAEGGGGGGGGAVEQAAGSSDAQGAAGAQGLPTQEDGKQREVQMSAPAAEAMKGQMQSHGAPQAQSAGMIVDSGGSAAPIPEDGGILRTDNWEQAIWVHPGGKLDEGGGLIERYRKLDDSPSHIWFDKKGKDTDEIAKDFAREARRPGVGDGDAKSREVEKLRNPQETPAA